MDATDSFCWNPLEAKNSKLIVKTLFFGTYRTALDYVLVEMRGIEPLTSALRTPRSPN
jgi:hypothetical protein